MYGGFLRGKCRKGNHFVNTKKKMNNNITGVWLMVFLLLLLLLATIALLASIYKGIAAGENNVIGLFPNDAVEAMATNVRYAPAELEPELDAFDENVSWETQTDVDLFQTAYVGKNGEVTVESANGDKLIAPGTSNSYHFSLRNTGNVSLDYTLNLEGVFELSSRELPFQVRLSRGNDWIVGGETQWVTIDELNEVHEKGTLGVGRYITYTLEWQWPFENDDADMLLLQNINDTLLGNVSAAANTNFHLTITTVSEATPGAVATDENGNPIYTPVFSQKGITYIGAPLAVSFGLLLGLLLLLLLWRRKIYVTGFVTGMSGGTMKWKRKEDMLRADGRFVFPRMAPGKHTFIFRDSDGTQTKLRWVLKRKSKVEGIQFAYKDDRVIVIAGKRIRAVELYVKVFGNGMDMQSDTWAAIDRKHNVYTPMGKKEPDEDHCNMTPGGLTVDKRHRLSFETTEQEIKL